MLRFRAPCPPSSSPAPAASSAATPFRPCSPPAIASSRSCGRRPPARWSSAACRPRSARTSRSGSATSRVPRRSVRRWPASTPSSTSSPSRATLDGGADLRLVNTEGTRDRRRGDAGGRRPAARPHGRDGRRRRPGPPLRELQGQGRGARPRRPASTGRSSSRRSSSARATGSSTSSRASSGCRPASSRCRATVRRASSRSTSGDVATVVVARPRGPGDRRRRVRAGRAALLDVPGDHPRGPDGARQAAGDRPDARAAHPPRRRRGRARPHPVPRRDRPAAPAPARQHRPARPDPDPRSGSSPARWRARSATSGRSRATRSPSRHDRGPRP